MFLPYGEETYIATQTWICERAIFDERELLVDFAAAVAR